jgi:hypothetical protein
VCARACKCFVVMIYLQVCVCANVLFCTLYLVTHSFHTCISHLFSFSVSISRMYLCDMFCLIAVCVQIITYFHFPTHHHQLSSCLWQSVFILCKVRGMEGNRWNVENVRTGRPDINIIVVRKITYIYMCVCVCMS